MNRPHVQEDGPVEGSQSIQTFHPQRRGLCWSLWLGQASRLLGRGRRGFMGEGQVSTNGLIYF